MPIIDLNFGGVERPKFEPLPEGDYQLTLTDLEVKKGKTDPTKVIAHCIYEVVGHDNDEYNGKKVRHFQTLNDSENMGYAKVWYEALIGEPVDDDISLDPDDLIGRVVEAHVGQQADNRDSTKMQNKISYFVLPFETD